jgi:hypothetical protein
MRMNIRVINDEENYREITKEKSTFVFLKARKLYRKSDEKVCSVHTDLFDSS